MLCHSALSVSLNVPSQIPFALSRATILSILLVSVEGLWVTLINLKFLSFYFYTLQKSHPWDSLELELRLQSHDHVLLIRKQDHLSEILPGKSVL